MKVLVAASGMWNDRKTLAAVRSLGKAGAHVTVAGDRHVGQPFYSRYCNRRVNLPSPVSGSDGFGEALLAHVRHQGYDVLLPVCDYAAAAVAARLGEFALHVRTPVPEAATLARAHDKWQTLTLAKAMGVGIPVSFCPRDAEEVRQAAAQLTYPCVLKLRKGAGANGLRYLKSPEELLDCYRERRAGSDGVFDHSFPILQEYVPGETHDVCLLFNRGRARAALTQRRILTYPPSGGIGIYNETTDEPEMRSQAITLLEALSWHGPAQVEFLLDARDGRPKLMEINSRFWGGLDLAIQAGVDFPVLACRMLMEGDVEPVLRYRVGLRYRWTLPFGLAHALVSRNKLQSMWMFLRLDAGATSDLWLSDPFPHLAEMFWTSGPRIQARLATRN